ncbi:MAG: translation initiation factor IF-2 [bacterium]
MDNENGKNIVSRPPVVVVLGHIDHGKTSLLDNIRQSHIADKESGGITQHVGAYEIEYHSTNQEGDNKKITFIDTPGHEAFSAMRSRSARVADIALLVVAADEGVKPQTKEAIDHIKTAGIETIVVINKIDKPGADPEKIKRELLKEDMVTESMGGTIPSVKVSAVTGEGISELLEMIILLAEVKNISGNISAKATGVVIEALMDSQRGPSATLIIRDGTLSVGDVIGTSSSFGRLKSILNFQGKPIGKAGPSTPVVVFGLEGVPRVGEEFNVFENTDTARANIQAREISINNEKEEDTDQQPVPLIVKADFLGSLEAIQEILGNLPQGKISLKILRIEVGDITESDVTTARDNEATIIAFRVKVSPIAKNLIEREKVRIARHNTVYEMVEYVRKLMERSIDMETVRLGQGKIKILAVFLNDKNRQILGGKVIDGEVKRIASVDIIRGDEAIGRGKVISLQQSKKNVEKVSKGNECGLLFESDTRVMEGDILSFYTEERRRPEI